MINNINDDELFIYHYAGVKCFAKINGNRITIVDKISSLKNLFTIDSSYGIPNENNIKLKNVKFVKINGDVHEEYPEYFL